MVVFVDYESDAFDNHQHHLSGEPGALLHTYVEPPKSILSKLTIVSSELPCPNNSNNNNNNNADVAGETSQSATAADDERENPNRNAFSAALSCYPVVKEIAQCVDLNTLHALSRTCRQFHANLAPFRQQLVKQTLRCENEYIETLSDMLDSGAAISDSVKSVLRLLSQGALESGRMTSGKVGKCARDMVAECRRCSKIVCRNCTVKAPSSSMLKNRLRRLCVTCRTAPLACHLSFDPTTCDTQALSNPLDAQNTPASAFMRTPCSCDLAVWLCYQCGQTLRSNDTTYRRVWTWRTRYSTYLGGGLGTGIGEGCQGVKCGRGENCLAAQEIELELVDGEGDELSSTGSSDSNHHNHMHGHGHGHLVGSPNHGLHDILPSDRRDSHAEEEPGYFRQEIVGIGGRVKHKVKKRVTVGACVVEHEDERESARYLVREENGRHRSWCGWCWRVVPAKHELPPAQ